MQNREIKFRAWDKSGEYFKPLEDDDDYHFRDYGDGLHLWDKWGECKNVILLQYTGLKDKNGKEIYEGDIVKCHDHPTGASDTFGEVYWKDGKWMVTWSMVDLGDYGTAWIEVIGNIHENPSLLTQ